MAMTRDLARARSLLRRMLAGRRAQRQLRRRGGALLDRGAGDIRVAVYFADPAVNLYQVRQWYRPLAALAERHSVAFVTRNARSALAMLRESPVPVAYAPSVADLESFVAAHRPRVVLYVNQNTRNFQMFRYGRMWHVFINHGESDKMYMTTNQFKAYDYALVAGQAALNRLGSALWDFDLDRRAIPIGRPQADHLGGEAPYPLDDRVTVLYAPTWEGDRASASYGSIHSHGQRIVDAVLASPRHRLVYRPHPRSGVIDRDYRAAQASLVAAIAAANAVDPAAHHVYDTAAEIGWQLTTDVAITDISAMVYDRLATGRPLIITRPAAPGAEVDESGYLGAAEWLRADDAGEVLAVIDRVRDDPGSHERLAHWSAHHFGDTEPGSATERFHAAIDTLMARWEAHAAE